MKKLLLVLTAAALCLVLVGCGSHTLGGTYVGEFGSSIEFSGDRYLWKVVAEGVVFPAEGTFTLDGDKIILDGDSGVVFYYDAERDVVSMDFGIFIDEYVKKR